MVAKVAESQRNGAKVVPKVAKGEPRGAKREPKGEKKGTKREPKATKSEPKGVKSEPQIDTRNKSAKGTKTLNAKVMFWEPFGRAKSMNNFVFFYVFHKVDRLQK